MEYQPPVGGGANDPYVNGNPATGTEGSIPPAAAIEHPMREIVQVLVDAGLTPDSEDLGQLSDAIGILIAASLAGDATETTKGLIEVATAAEAQALTDAVRALTPATLASALAGGNHSLSANGYQKLPGGLILQWGLTASLAHTASQAVTLPIAFPNAGFCVFGLPRISAGTANSQSVSGIVLSTTQIEITNTSGAAASFAAYWWALGH